MKVTDAKLLTGASAVAALIALLLALIHFTLWLVLLLIPLAALSVLRRVGILEEMDEFHRLNNARSGNIALYATILFIAAMILQRWITPSMGAGDARIGRYSDVVAEYLWVVLFFAACVKVFSMLVLSLPYRQAAMIIGAVCGLLYLSFGLVVVSMQPSLDPMLLTVGIGLAVLGITALAGFYPRIGGVLLIAVWSAFLVWRHGHALGYGIKSLFTGTPVKDVVLSMLQGPAPLILAGILLIASHWQEYKERIDEKLAVALKSKPLEESNV